MASGKNPMEEALRRFQQVAQSGRSGFGNGGRQPPRGFGIGILGFAAAGAGLFLFQNALFNVDGGHRAIKYRRLSGVSPEIYAEGKSRPSHAFFRPCSVVRKRKKGLTMRSRNSLHDSLVRNPRHL